MDTVNDAERLEAAVAAIQQKEADVRALTDLEWRCLDVLRLVNEAESRARDSFSAFYATLAVRGETSPTDQMALPPEVALQMGRWVEARRAWEITAAELLATRPAAPVRRGPRLRARPPAALRIPTALPAKDALSALFAPHLWKTDVEGGALVAQTPSAQVRVELDDVLGFGPERAIQQIAKYGASAAQTFLSMIALWQQKSGGQPHETYLTIYASDLLRFQGRKATPRGGYHRDDLLAKGRDVYFLSRVSLPRAEVMVGDDGRRVMRTLSVGRLLSLESLEAITLEDEPGSVQSIIRFRYHLGREVYDWVGGDEPQFAAISSKLLSYHPVRQKYQILLGFCLAHFDRAHRRDGVTEHRIALPALLRLANLPLPERRLAAFLATIEDALNELSRDGVVPGLQLLKPEGWAAMLAVRRTRDVIAGSVVVFPHLKALATSPVEYLPEYSP